MKVKVTLARSGPAGGSDLLVEADPTALAGALADAIVERDPDGTAGAGLVERAIRVESAGGEHVVSAERLLSDATLRSGDRISVVDGAGRFVDAGDDRAAAVTLIVTSGPDAGARFPLRRGASQVGRGTGCEVTLTDRMVSKRHARVNVTEIVEILDLASANGLTVNDQRVPRAVLRAGDQIRIGETSMAVEDHRRRSAEVTGSVVAFNRSPYLDPRYPEGVVEAPKPPSPPSPPKLPLIAMVAPLVMGAVLYAVSRNLLSIVFIGLSPILMLGNYLEGRRSQKAGVRDATDAYRAALDRLAGELDRNLAEEGARRRLEHPPSAQVIGAARSRAPMLWCRRPDRHGFLEVRLGAATLPSRTFVKMPGVGTFIPGLAEELGTVVAARRTVADVPVVAELPACGALGIAGPPDDANGAARSVVGQIAGLHSPAEVAIAAVVGPRGAETWDWVKWLPHATPEPAVVDGPMWACDAERGTVLTAALRDLVDRRLTGTPGPGPQPAVVVVVGDDALVERSLLTDLVERGPAARVHVVWTAPNVGRLPAGCTVYVDHDAADHRATVGLVATGTTVGPVEADHLDASAALTFARDLAPVVDASVRVDEESELPARVSLLDHLGVEVALGADAVVERWTLSGSLPGDGRQRRNGPAPLHAVVGSAAHEPLQLDLRAHGPHALVGGTTGSGKSEFLQSWITSLAVTHSPARVTFLFVDYKGGAAFGECVRLPHSLGLVTDLTPHLVNRALRSLRAELTHREKILTAKKAKDVLTMEQNGDPDTPPALVIVVDEFAALVGEVPEFVDGVVDIAQRGRSLGLHLVLATQRPAGVIKENLRANTNLRVALRMADEADSTDVIGTDQAAGFDPAVPGRAVAKLGPGRLAAFQAAYVGGWTTGEAPPAEVRISDLRIDSDREWRAADLPEGTVSLDDDDDEDPTDLARLVDQAGAAAKACAIDPPRRPWLPALDTTYDLGRNPTSLADVRLISRTDAELVFGLRDDPDNQAQHAVAFNPDSDGNMAVIGTGGSGKSAFLRTLAIAGALSTRGGPCHVYGLDFASRGLDMLDELPNVGSIVGGDDDERVARLLRTLRETIDERLARYSAHRADTIEQYRVAADRPDEPRILLLVDGYPAFKQAYEATVGRTAIYEMLLSVATDGRQAGVHVVISADRVGGVATSLASVIQRWLVLRLANEAEYGFAGAPPGVFPEGTPPGRGWFAGFETQVAVLGGSANTAKQAAAIRTLADGLREMGVAEAPPVQRLASEIDLTELPPSLPGHVVAGRRDDDLGPFIAPLDTPLLVVGPARSGKTTTLLTLLRSAAPTLDDSITVYVGEGSTAVVEARSWNHRLLPGPEVAAQVDALAAAVQSSLGRPIALVIEGATRVAGWPEADKLAALVDAVGRQPGGVVLSEGETAGMSATPKLLQALKASRHVILLVPDQYDGENIFKTPLPRLRRRDFPPGRGFHLRDGVATKVHVARSDGGG